MHAIVLDLRNLAPPGPMERILDAIADLPAGTWLQVLLPHEPRPLYGLLEAMNCQWHTRTHEPGMVEVLIWPADMPIPPLETANR